MSTIPLWLRISASTRSRWPGSTAWCSDLALRRVALRQPQHDRGRLVLLGRGGRRAAGGGTAPRTSVFATGAAGGWAAGGGCAATSEFAVGGAGAGAAAAERRGCAWPLPLSGCAGAAGAAGGTGGGGARLRRRSGGLRRRRRRRGCGGLGLRRRGRRGLGGRLGRHLRGDRLHEARRLPAQVLTAAAEIPIRRVLSAAALTRPHDSTFFFAAFTRRRYVLWTGLYCSIQRAIAA